MSQAEPFLSAQAPAKLNLFLHVVGQRADGYHLLQTVFTLVDWCDEIHFQRRLDGQIQRLSEMPGVAAEEDLVVRAARLLQSHTHSSYGVDIHVDKQLPSGAGLGGGSSDAATSLIALNHLWQTNLSAQELAELGLQLGADVPVFIFGRSAFAQGVGEELQDLPLRPQHYVLIQPDLFIPTPAIFKAPDLCRETPSQSLAEIRAGLEATMSHNLTHAELATTKYYGRNDLENVALSLYPGLKALVHALHQQGWPVRMTGSGSCFFLPVNNPAQAQQLASEVRIWAQQWQAQSAQNLRIKLVKPCASIAQHPAFALLNEPIGI